METIDANGNKIEFQDDGSIKITTKDGRTFLMDKDGGIHADLGTIKRVSFENIFDLKSHIIMREGELTVHKAEFNDGGTVKIAFTSQGKLVEFTCSNVGQTITKENEIIIRSKTAADAKENA